MTGKLRIKLNYLGLFPIQSRSNNLQFSHISGISESNLIAGDTLPVSLFISPSRKLDNSSSLLKRK